MTEITQLALAAKAAVGQVLVCLKSPVAEIVLSVMGVEPELVKVTVFGALLVVSSWLSYPRLAGDMTPLATLAPGIMATYASSAPA